MNCRFVYLLIILGIYVSVILFVFVSRVKQAPQIGLVGHNGSISSGSQETPGIFSGVPSSWEREIGEDTKEGGADSASAGGTSNRPNTRQPIKTHLMDVLASPGKLADFEFSKCDMSSCFDLVRCNSSGTLKVHIVTSATKNDPEDAISVPPGESNIIHGRILKIIRQSKYYEPNPTKACLFVPEDDLLDRDPLSTSFRKNSLDLLRSEHSYGMNYLIFNLYSGTWPDYQENDFSGFKLGAAILAKASNSVTYHRKQYDISIPLFSYLHPTKSDTQRNVGDASPLSANKTYFLTFKGKRYVIGSGSDTRNGLYHLNNKRDVVMLTTCNHGKKWRNVDDKRCSEDENEYGKYDFNDLMSRSTFCLTPRGRRLGSFRFLEALNHTCIPVVLADGWVWPFDEIIDWSLASLQFLEQDLFLVADLLRDISPDQIKAMQLACRKLYDKYFASLESIVLTAIEIIERRVKSLADPKNVT